MVDECSSTNGCVQGYESLLWDAIRSTALSDAAQDGYECEAELFISDTLAETFNNRSSVPIFIGSKCGTQKQSPCRTFHSTRRSCAVYSLFIYCFKGTHDFVVPPRHASFLLQEKDYESVAVSRNKSEKFEDKTNQRKPSSFGQLAYNSTVPKLIFFYFFISALILCSSSTGR